MLILFIIISGSLPAFLNAFIKTLLPKRHRWWEHRIILTFNKIITAIFTIFIFKLDKRIGYEMIVTFLLFEKILEILEEFVAEMDAAVNVLEDEVFDEVELVICCAVWQGVGYGDDRYLITQSRHNPHTITTHKYDILLLPILKQKFHIFYLYPFLPKVRIRILIQYHIKIAITKLFIPFNLKRLRSYSCAIIKVNFI